jgi:hypothetical protein
VQGWEAGTEVFIGVCLVVLFDYVPAWRVVQGVGLDKGLDYLGKNALGLDSGRFDESWCHGENTGKVRKGCIGMRLSLDGSPLSVEAG